MPLLRSHFKRSELRFRCLFPAPTSWRATNRRFSQPRELASGKQGDVATPLVINNEDRSRLDRELLGELPSVRAFLGRLLRGRGDVEVEDLVQETVARALRYRSSYDSEFSLGPWLRRTAFRVFLDHASPTPSGSTAELVEPEAPPAELHGLLERDESLAHLLSSLHGVEREVLTRFHRDEQPLSEIAASLHLPIGTVKSHLHRARKRLRAEELS